MMMTYRSERGDAARPTPRPGPPPDRAGLVRRALDEALATLRILHAAAAPPGSRSRASGRAAGGIALDRKARAARALAGAVGQVAGQAKLRTAPALHLLSGGGEGAAGALDDVAAARPPRGRRVGEPCRSGRATVASTSFAASGEVSRSLVWPWNCGSRRKTEASRRPGHDVFRTSLSRSGFHR